MTVKVSELMTVGIITSSSRQTVGHAKKKMKRRKISFMPVVDPKGVPKGVISMRDLVAHEKNATPVSNLMTKRVYTIPSYENVEVAARMMRNHKIHHLIITHEKKAVGVLSSFDLLELIVGKRFGVKKSGTQTSKSRGKRKYTYVQVSKITKG